MKRILGMVICALMIMAGSSFGQDDEMQYPCFIEGFTVYNGGSGRQSYTLPPIDPIQKTDLRASFVANYGASFFASFGGIDIFHIPSSISHPGHIAVVYYDLQNMAKRVIIFNDLP